MAKRNVWFTIFKIILVFVGIVALIFVGGYFLIKNKFGIDLLDLKNKIALLNKDFEESEIFSIRYDDEDNYNAFKRLFGDNNQVYTFVDGKYIFDNSELSSYILQNDTILTDEELTSIFNLILNTADENIFDENEEEYLKYVELKEIKFSNLLFSTETTVIQANCVYEFKINSSSESDKLSSFIIDSFIPKSIFITTIFNIEFSNDYCFDYIVTNLHLTINALSEDDSNSILSLFSSLFKIDSKEDLQNSFNSLTASLIFGDENREGFVKSIVGNNGFYFVENNNQLNYYYLQVKK